MKRLRVLFIDWNNTLSISRFWEHLESMTHPLHHIHEPVAETLFLKEAPLKQLLLPWMRGEYATEEVVKQVSDQSQVDYKIVLKEFIQSCEQMRFVSDEVPDLVMKIRNKGIKVVIATDNMDSFDRWTVPAMKLRELFDDILNSHSLKGVKKDKDIEGRSVFFDKFMKKYSLKSDESLLIDDSRDGVDIVQGFGIHYHLVEKEIGLVPALHALHDTL